MKRPLGPSITSSASGTCSKVGSSKGTSADPDHPKAWDAVHSWAPDQMVNHLCLMGFYSDFIVV